MKETQYYISLGAGNHQLPLILAAKKAGFSVIGIDHNSLAPGMAHCDIKIIESIFNYRRIVYKIESLILEGIIVGGYCASYGKALSSWAYIAEKFNLPFMPGSLIRELNDKLHVRNRLATGIQHPLFAQPDFLHYQSTVLKADLQKLGFPLIIKTRSGYGKKNILRADNFSAIKPFLTRSALEEKDLSREELLIEQEIKGDEITVSGLVENGVFYLCLISDKLTSSEPPFIELEHNYPSAYAHLEKEIEDLHRELIRVLNISTGPLVSEWKIKDNRLYLVEISAQIPGEYIASFMIPQAIGYDYFYNLVRLTSGQSIEAISQPETAPPVKIRYWDRQVSAEEWKKQASTATFASIINPTPPASLQSNMDRFGVMGFVG